MQISGGMNFSGGMSMVMPGPPGAPIIGVATATGGTTATVSFTAPASDGGGTISSYTAVSSPGNITGTISQSGSGTITVSGLTKGTAYTFVVYATNSAGNSANSNASNSVTPATVPDAPTIGTATATGPTTATVSFTAPADGGGATITSYTAVSTPGGITGTLSQSGSGTITVNGLTSGTAYTFVVYATNSIGNSVNSASSNSITTTTGQVIVSAGFYTSSVIDRNFKLWIWGYGSGGEMGEGNRVSRSSPVQLGTDTWSQVSGANQSMFAIKSNGTLWAWGSDFGSGSLGLNTTTVNRSSPTQIGSNTNWSQVIRAGTGVGGATGAINNLGQLFAWGINDYGALGQNDKVYRSNPVQITGSWTLATIGYGTSMAIDTAGKLFTWGQNYAGQLGSNNTISRSSPVQIMTTTSFVSISASDDHQGAIDTLGRLWVWGSSFSGQLGNNSTTNRSSPVQIPGSWSVVSMGNAYTHAIKTDGTLWAWGDNTYGQLGLGNRINRSSPIQVGTSSWISISSGLMGPVGVTVSNVVYAWGRDEAGSTIMGRIGAGVVVNRSSPYQVGTY